MIYIINYIHIHKLISMYHDQSSSDLTSTTIVERVFEHKWRMSAPIYLRVAGHILNLKELYYIDSNDGINYTVCQIRQKFDNYDGEHINMMNIDELGAILIHAINRKNNNYASSSLSVYQLAEKQINKIMKDFKNNKLTKSLKLIYDEERQRKTQIITQIKCLNIRALNNELTKYKKDRVIYRYNLQKLIQPNTIKMDTYTRNIVSILSLKKRAPYIKQIDELNEYINLINEEIMLKEE